MSDSEPTSVSTEQQSDTPENEKHVLKTGIRLHPSSPLFIIIDFIKHFFFPLVIALFAGGGKNYELIGAIFVVPAVGFAILQYWVYRYVLADKEIVVREGVLFKNVRHVPYERIQNLNLSRNPLHRLMGVAQLELESASGGKPEAVMRVISLDAVEDIKKKVLEAKRKTQSSNAKDAADQLNSQKLSGPDRGLENPLLAKRSFGESSSVESASSVEGEHALDEVENKKSILSIPVGELIKAGLISNKGMLVVAAFLGIAGQTGALEAILDKLEVYFKSTFDGFQLDMGNPVTIVGLTVVGIIFFILFIRVLSILFMVFTYYGFHLVESSEKLIADYGLITQLHATIPKQRIQMVSYTQNWLHQWFKRAAVRVATAGGGQVQGQNLSKFKWIAPIIDANDIDTFLDNIQPESDFQVNEWHYVEFRAWRRIVRTLGSLLLITTGILMVTVSTNMAWLLLLFVWIVIYARKLVASMRYGVTSTSFVYESGWLVKHRTFVPIEKVQSIELSDSPFDRRNKMKSMEIDVAGLDSNQHHINIKYLDEQHAQHLYESWNDKVCATSYRWK